MLIQWYVRKSKSTIRYSRSTDQHSSGSGYFLRSEVSLTQSLKYECPSCLVG